MINCKKSENGNGYYFETKLSGDGEQIMNELAYIEGAFIGSLRKIDIPDESIERLLAEVICEGFKIADKLKEEGNYE